MKIIVYDLETMPNCFTFCGYVEDLKQVFVFEISDRKNQRQELLNFLNYAAKQEYYFVGFNNIGFDYQILHQLIVNPYTFTYQRAAELCQQIIFAPKNTIQLVKTQDRTLKQIDLFKIHHLDNAARRSSLKALQFAMRSESVEDLPFDIRPLNDAEKDTLIHYNIHDVMETYKFYLKSKHLIQLRYELQQSNVIYGDVLNYSDVKIGTEYLVKEIGREKCYGAYGKPNQTLTDKVALKDVILDKIYYYNPEFESIKEYFKTLVWFKDRENNLSFNKVLRGFDYYFGVGGIHGSVEKKYFEANDTHEIIDLDVTSLYPSLGIVNGFYPTHLGESFVEKYASLKTKRLQHGKGTPLNAMFKLALNGAYGKSNDPYSPFYDPTYMLKITINGQLQLLQLAEQLGSVPNVEIIQINTDGITCYVPKDVKPFFNLHRDAWQAETGLELEEAYYSKMWVNDVNNYMCISTKGKIKSKGCYFYPETDTDYDGQWHKDFSAMIIPKAARIALMDGVNPEYLVRLFTDPYDFCLRFKTPSGSNAYIGDQECTKTVRYYVSKTGKPMTVKSKPKGVIGTYKRKNSLTDEFYNKILNEIPVGTWDERIHTGNKSVYEIVERSIESGRLVKGCNNIKDFDITDIDYDYYTKEIMKLCF